MFLARHTANTPLNTSPAAVVSTARNLGGGQAETFPSVPKIRSATAQGDDDVLYAPVQKRLGRLRSTLFIRHFNAR